LGNGVVSYAENEKRGVGMKNFLKGGRSFYNTTALRFLLGARLDEGEPLFEKIS